MLLWHICVRSALYLPSPEKMLYRIKGAGILQTQQLKARYIQARKTHAACCFGLQKAYHAGNS